MKRESTRGAKIVVLVVFSVLAVSRCGWWSSQRLDPELVLARFDGEQVSAGDVIAVILERRQLENLFRLSLLGDVESEIRKALPAIARRKVIAARARAEGLDATDTFRAWRIEKVNRLLGQMVLDVDTILKTSVSEEDVERYYRDNPSEFTQPETYTFRAIACLYENWGREGARKRLEEALAQVEAGRDFAEVALEYSDSPRHLRGRPQGPYVRGDGMPISVEQAIISLATGEHTGIIEGERGKGAAIYQLIDRTQPKKKELTPTLRFQIRSQICREKRQREEKILVARLVERDALVYRPNLLSDASVDEASVALEVRGLPPLTVGDLRREPGSWEEMTTIQRRDFFDDRAASLLLLAEARRRGYTEKDVAPRVACWEREELEDRYVRFLLDQEDFTIDRLRRHYLAHRNEFVTEPRYKLYRIFVAAEIREDMSRVDRFVSFEAARARAEAIYKRIAQEGLPFQDAAREYSSDRVTAGQGGYVGYVRLSELGSEYATLFEIASQLEAGLITQPRLATYQKKHLGSDIYFCSEIEPSHALSFEEALPEIGKILAQQRRKELYAQLCQEIEETCPLKVDDQAVKRLAENLTLSIKSSPNGADLIKSLLPRSRLQSLGL